MRIGVPRVPHLDRVALGTWVDWSDLAVLAITYVLTGYGVTLGFHRLLTHSASGRSSRSFMQ